MEQYDARLRTVTGQLQTLREQLANSAGLKLPVTAEAYLAATQALDEYQRNVQELELSWRGYENSQENARRSRERLIEIMADVDSLKENYCCWRADRRFKIRDRPNRGAHAGDPATPNYGSGYVRSLKDWRRFLEKVNRPYYLAGEVGEGFGER